MIEINRNRRGVIYKEGQTVLIPHWRGKAVYIADHLDGPGLFWGAGDTFKQAALSVGKYVPVAREWAMMIPNDY